MEKAVTNCQDALHIFENMAVPSYKHMRIIHNKLCFRLEYLSRAEEAMIHCKKSIVFGKSQLDQINNRNDSVQSEIELVTIKIDGYKQKEKHGSSGRSEEELISEPSEIANTVEEPTSDPAHDIFSGTTDCVKEAASNPANDIFSGTSEAVKEAHIAADQLMSQGRLAAVQGDYQKTISCYKDALRIRFSLYGKLGCLQAYHDLGRAHLYKYYHDYEEKNDVENDLDLALEMLNLAREVCHGDEAKKFWEADILLDMIRVLQQKEDFNQVITYCHEALHLLESIVKPDHPKVDDVIFQLALCFEKLSKTEEAIEEYRKALSLCLERRKGLLMKKHGILMELKKCTELFERFKLKYKDLKKQIENEGRGVKRASSGTIDGDEASPKRTEMEN